jgi:hypothetical protein
MKMTKVRPAGSMMTLDESMFSLVEVSSFKGILEYLADNYPFLEATVDNTTIKPYGYDNRINWNTHIVCVSGAAVLFTDGSVE